MNKNNPFKKIKSVALWLIIIIPIIIYIYNYNQIYNVGYEINHTLEGIKYQANNMESEIPVKISIKGIYKKDYSTKDYMFEGDIIIDNEPFYSSNRKTKKYLFNEYNMTSIENDNSGGNFFIGDMMSEMTIMISVPNQKGGRSFSFDDGWLISAPCKTRNEALAISNKLIYPSYGINIGFDRNYIFGKVEI